MGPDCPLGETRIDLAVGKEKTHRFTPSRQQLLEQHEAPESRDFLHRTMGLRPSHNELRNHSGAMTTVRQPRLTWFDDGRKPDLVHRRWNVVDVSNHRLVRHTQSQTFRHRRSPLLVDCNC